MKKICIFFALLFAFARAENIKIGVVLPLSGSVAGYGQSALEGVKIAHSMKPSLNGSQIELVVLDSKGDKIESNTAATRLISSDKVLGIIGEMVTANTLQVMSAGENAKVPTIAPAATSDKLLIGKKYSSRVCFMDSFQGGSLAKYAFQKLGYKKALIISDNGTDYSIGLAKAFEKEFKAQGGEIVAKFNVSSKDRDFKAVISQIQRAKADFVFVPLYYNEASLLVRQARSAGLNTPFSSADGVADESFMELAGSASEGYIFTDNFDASNPPTEFSKEFIQNYEKEKGTKAVPNFTAMGADAYFVFYNALQKCEGDLKSECINNAIHKTTDFQGVSGVINIGEDGNARRSLVVKEIKDKKAVFKDLINP